jgi:hypothetical protein
LRWSLGLQLSVEYIRSTSGFCLVDRALVNVLLLSSILRDRERSAINDWYDRELLLGVAFFELTKGNVPPGTLYLETENVSTFLRRLLVLRIPVKLLGNLCLDVKLVKLLLLLSSVYLLNSSQE